ncbi:MAG: AgmX/PglI C-terminal domain-containing protein, partial [Bdellovibrionota bacterium]
GFETKKSPPVAAKPKGSFGQTSSRAQTRRSERAGGGTGDSKNNARSNQQAPSQAPKPKPQVRVEEQGLFGAFQGAGGGGDSNSGAELEGAGLSGELQDAFDGLEKGVLSDSRGSGGRGSQGRSFGGGGQSIDVGGLGTAGKGGGRSGFGLGSSGTKGEAEVSFVAEEIEVRDGLTREEIERVVRSRLSEIRACHERAMIQSGNAGLAGRMKVSWFVNRDGRVENVRRESDIGQDTGLYECVAARLRTWQFPRPRGGSGAQVAWPFLFRTGG